MNNLLIRLTLSNFSSNIDFVLLFDSGYTGDYALHALLFLNLYMVASIEQDGCNYIQSSDHYYILPLQAPLRHGCRNSPPSDSQYMSFTPQKCNGKNTRLPYTLASLRKNPMATQEQIEILRPRLGKY